MHPLVERLAPPYLEGEDPLTPYGLDARHWVAIYREMVALREDMLERQRGAMPTSEARNGTTDIALIETQLQRLRRRLAFWQRRHYDLSGIDFDPETRVLSHGEKSAVLTRRESQLLQLLLMHPGRYFSARALAATAWRDGSLAQEQVRTYVGRLRRVVEDLGLPCQLQTRPRWGYGLIFD